VSLSTSLRCLLFALGVTQRATTLLAAIHSISPTSSEPRTPPWGAMSEAFGAGLVRMHPANRFDAQLPHNVSRTSKKDL
jgi:hypothetical protein